MRVTFAEHSPMLASTRLRATIPQRELVHLGVLPGRDVLVIGKHGFDWDEATAGYRKVVYDVCDDHFRDDLSEFYLDACMRADAITCNSEEMRRVVKDRTGRDAWCIPDPWEAEEGPARIHERLLWFGHRTNLQDLLPWLPALAGRPLSIASNARIKSASPKISVAQWSPAEMDKQFAEAGLVILPTGKSMAKSANRAIESIRRGVFPICGPLPAYGELGVYVGNVSDGVDWALSHQDEVMRRIKAAQVFVNYEFHPSRIARLWLETLRYI